MKKYLTRVLASALALLMVVTIAPTELGLSQVHAANYTEAQLKAMKTVEITDGSAIRLIIREHTRCVPMMTVHINRHCLS